MLIFFDELWEFIEKNLSRDYKHEYIFFGLLNIDQNATKNGFLVVKNPLLITSVKKDFSLPKILGI